MINFAGKAYPHSLILSAFNRQRADKIQFSYRPVAFFRALNAGLGQGTGTQPYTFGRCKPTCFPAAFAAGKLLQQERVRNYVSVQFESHAVSVVWACSVAGRRATWHTGLPFPCRVLCLRVSLRSQVRSRERSHGAHQTRHLRPAARRGQRYGRPPGRNQAGTLAHDCSGKCGRTRNADGALYPCCT